MEEKVILAVSDTHGDTGALASVIRRHREEIHAVFHLGDFARDLTGLVPDGVESYSVAGNMDGLIRHEEDLEKTVHLGYLRILLTHSDHLGSHFSLERLALRAEELSVDLCVFGHTHSCFYSRDSKPFLFNPGSLGRKVQGSKTYGIIRIGQELECLFLNL